MTYAALSRRVDEVASRLGGPRRLVLLEGRNTVETVTSYLGALAAGHVVLLAAPGQAADRLRTAYEPDVVIDAAGGIDVLREVSAHDLHEDLALVLSTSGSTGSTKLVRLSADNLAANAVQIDEALGIRTDDRAALTLPITYCYGLSVVHTHLAKGASVLLTELSVVDECFWALFREAEATTFPGVPHTFELLERSGFAGRDLPHLRYVTQAGGRMEPTLVTRFADLGIERGWDLVVMYGQCEATARMAYLPPDLASEHPEAVGVPVPGATIEIEDGEIVFRGPNVMLGYAEGPADLALGRTVDALHTGDLGRLTPEGLLQVVGRRARFVKVLGHRVDLETLERRLRADGHDVRIGGRDGLVVVASRTSAGAVASEELGRVTSAACGAPGHAVRVFPVADYPVLSSGKVDYPAILRLAEPEKPSPPSVGTPAAPARGSVAELYAALLQVPVVEGDTFVGLGGDSLSYVEVSVALEELLGQLPPSWHVTPVGELDALRTAASAAGPQPGAPTDSPDGPAATGGLRSRLADAWHRRSRTMETSVWLRALAIVLIVGTHAGLFALQGSANALLVVAGYQLARFHLREPARRVRARRILSSVTRIVVPSLVVIVSAHVFGGYYEVRNLFLANWLLGEPHLGPPWRFWFIEAVVLAMVVVAALTSVRWIEGLDRRHPVGLPLALSVAAFILFRLPILPLPVPHLHGSALVVLHLFLLGWALARATTPAHRRLLTVVVVAMVGTFSFNPARDGLTAALVLLLLWRPVTKVPAVLVPAIRVLAAASLYIYVIHWQALELLWGAPVPAFVGAMSLGLAYWWLWTRPLTTLGRSARGWLGRRLARDPERATTASAAVATSDRGGEHGRETGPHGIRREDRTPPAAALTGSADQVG